MDNKQVISNALARFKARKDIIVQTGMEIALKEAMEYAMELHRLDETHKAHDEERNVVHYGWILTHSGKMVSYGTNTAEAMADGWAASTLERVPYDDLPGGDFEWIGFLVADMTYDFLDWDWEVSALETVKGHMAEKLPVYMIRRSNRLKKI